MSKAWTSTQMVMLKRLADSGANFASIAIAMDRSVDSCKTAWRKYFGGSSVDNTPVTRTEHARIMKVRAEVDQGEAIGIGTPWETAARIASTNHLTRLREVHPEGYPNVAVRSVARVDYARAPSLSVQQSSMA